MEKNSDSKVTLLQYCGRSFRLAEILYAAALLWPRDLCYTLAQPLHSSYGQIGYTVYFPYANMPEVEYDWEKGRLTVDEENWQEYFQQS